jgi:hypothetical protein
MNTPETRALFERDSAMHKQQRFERAFQHASEPSRRTYSVHMFRQASEPHSRCCSDTCSATFTITEKVIKQRFALEGVLTCLVYCRQGLLVVNPLA